jgi:DNA-binding CsgD family transcriptional regulator
MPYGFEDIKIGERAIVSSVLGLIAVFITADLISDSREGATWWHLLLEASVVFLAGGGIAYLLHDHFKKTVQLDDAHRRAQALQTEAQQWRENARKHTEGLARAIEAQFLVWGLSAAETEVAFLLVKGFSTREIAGIRKTSEKTVRIQAAAIYEKSGLTGRSELAGFFLEDLM